MLSKKYRLPIQDFIKQRAVQGGSKFFKVLRFKAEKDYSRFGVILGRAVFKKAVDRNKLKRRIFAFIQKNQNRFPLGDFIIIVLPPAGEFIKKIKQAELADELKEIFRLQ